MSGRVRRRGALLPLAVLAVAAGAGGLDVLGASPAGADAAAAGQLGGFQTTATGAGIRTTYEQPNFPVPANPSLEANIGFATAAYNYGPSGSATASTLWPGQVAASALDELPLLLQPYLGSSTPNLSVGPWPVQATTAYPAAGGKTTSANQDATGVTMEASSTQDAGTATATFGTGSGQSAPAALPSGVVQVQSIGSTVLGTVQGATQGAQAVAQATSALHGVSIAGGLITVGAVTTTATSTSDGNAANVTGSSAVSQLSIAGQAVTVDKDGLHAAGQSQSLLGSLLPSVNSVLQTAGITIALAQPTDTVNGASAERVIPGLEITIDLTQFDQQFNALRAMLPAQLTSAVAMLPIPFPAEQVLTVNLGYVDVKAAAAPAFTASTPPTDSALGTGAGFADSGSSPTGDLGGAAGGLSDLGGASPATTAAATGAPVPTVASAPVALFKGIGAGLIALGLLLAGALAFLLLRADAAVGSLVAAPACAGEERPDL